MKAQPSTPGPSELHATVSAEQLLAHMGWVRALARVLAADPQTAEDLEQETWRYALERPPRHDGNLRAWFSRVARNLSRQMGRSEGARVRRERRVARETFEVSGVRAQELTAEASLQREVVDRVLALDEVYRSVLLLRYFRGLRPREVAQELGLPLNTVRSRQSRALARLRETLDHEHGRERWVRALVPVAAARGLLVRPALWLVMAGVLILPFTIMILVNAVGGGRRGAGPTAMGTGSVVAASPLEVGSRQSAARLELPPTGDRSEPVLRGALALRIVDGKTGRGVGDLDFAVLSERGGDRLLARGRTDADGRARITELPETTILVRTERRPPHGTGVGALWIRPGEENRLELTLDAGGTLAGRVVDDLGAPVPGLEVRSTVRLEAHDFPRGWRSIDGVLGSTDSEGRYRVDHLASLPRGVWIVDGEARPERWEAVRLRFQDPRFGNWLPGQVTSQVRPGEVHELEDVVLPRPVTVAGTVVDEEGAPLPGVLVSAHPLRIRRVLARFPAATLPAELALPPGDPGFTLFPGEALTDASGAFELRRPWSTGPAGSQAFVWTASGMAVEVEFPSLSPGAVATDVRLTVDAPEQLTLELYSGGAPIRRIDQFAPGRSRGTGAFASLSAFGRLGAQAVLADGQLVEREETVHGDGLVRIDLPRPATEIRHLMLRVPGHMTHREDLPSGVARGVVHRVQLEPRARLHLALHADELPPEAVGLNLQLRACTLSPEERGERGLNDLACCGLGAWATVALRSVSDGQLETSLGVLLSSPFWIYTSGGNGELDVIDDHHGPFEPGASVHPIAVAFEPSEWAANKEAPGSLEEPEPEPDLGWRLAELGYAGGAEPEPETQPPLTVRLAQSDGTPLRRGTRVALQEVGRAAREVGVDGNGRVELPLGSESAVLTVQEISYGHRLAGIQSLALRRSELVEDQLLELQPWREVEVVLIGIAPELRDAELGLHLVPASLDGEGFRWWGGGREVSSSLASERRFRFRVTPGTHRLFARGQLYGVEPTLLHVPAAPGASPRQVFEVPVLESRRLQRGSGGD